MSKNKKPGVDKRKLTRQEAYRKIVATVKEEFAKSEEKHDGRDVSHAIADEYLRWKNHNESATVNSETS